MFLQQRVTIVLLMLNLRFHQGTTKSTPYSLRKVTPQKQREANPEVKSLLQLQTSKILQISKRLSNPSRQRCTKNKWISCQSSSDIQQGYGRRNVHNAIKLDSQLSSSVVREELKAIKYSEIKVYSLETLDENRGELKSMKLDLKRYFEMFLKLNILGEMFQDLGDLIERYIEEVIQSQKQVDFEENNNQKQIFTSKIVLYDKLCQCQKLGKFDQLYDLLKRFCIPKAQLRHIFLQDVLSLLKIQLYEEFGLNQENQYVFLTPTGRIIKDFAEIKFSTKKLLIAEKSKANQLYQHYIDVIKNKNISSNKNAFRQTLKQNFRDQLTFGNFDDSPSSPKSNKEINDDWKSNVTRAQRIINFKNDKGSFGRVRLVQYLNKKKDQKKDKQRSPLSRIHFEREQTKMQLSSIDLKIIQQFKQLKRVNDYQDAQFKNDQSCRNKIQLLILIKENIYFKTKTEEQRDKILLHLKFIEKGQNLEEYSQKTISIEDYIDMRKIINCMGQKKHIVEFVDRYLSYDEYGQLQKEDLRKILKFVIGGEGKTSEMILMTIWSWLEKNGVIMNDILRRSHMQILYERNKIVYYFLISLIFGTNDTTALQLARGILI